MKPGDKRNAKIDADALRDLGDADVDDASLKAEPLWKHSNEDPRVEAVEEHLKDTVDGDEPGSIVGVATRQFIPDQHHRDAACNADQDEPAHVGRFAAQEHDGEDEHERRANEPVLNQRQPENSLLAEDFAQLLVSHFRQRREHHDDQPDGDGDIRRSALKAIDEPGRARDEVADRHSNGHREENPESEKAIEEGELLPLQRSADLTLRIWFAGHAYLASSAIGQSTGTGKGAP